MFHRRHWRLSEADLYPEAGWGDLLGDRKEYPFIEHTLGKKLEAESGLSVYCGTCKRSAVLDVAALAKRFGPDQGCMHCHLVKVIHCHDCRGAGRDDRNLQFTNHALTPGMRKRDV